MTLLLKLAARVGKRIIILPLLMNLEKKNADAINLQEKQLDSSKFNWYIQSVTLPVDNLGK